MADDRKRKHKAIELRRRQRLKRHFDELQALCVDVQTTRKDKDGILVSAIQQIGVLRDRLKKYEASTGSPVSSSLNTESFVPKTNKRAKTETPLSAGLYGLSSVAAAVAHPASSSSFPSMPPPSVSSSQLPVKNLGFVPRPPVPFAAALMPLLQWERSDTLLMLVDMDGAISSATPNTPPFFGLSPACFRATSEQKSLIELTHNDDLPHIYDVFQTLLKKQQNSMGVRLRLRVRGGSAYAHTNILFHALTTKGVASGFTCIVTLA